MLNWQKIPNGNVECDLGGAGLYQLTATLQPSVMDDHSWLCYLLLYIGDLKVNPQVIFSKPCPSYEDAVVQAEKAITACASQMTRAALHWGDLLET